MKSFAVSGFFFFALNKVEKLLTFFERILWGRRRWDLIFYNIKTKDAVCLLPQA